MRCCLWPGQKYAGNVCLGAIFGGMAVQLYFVLWVAHFIVVAGLGGWGVVGLLGVAVGKGCSVFAGGLVELGLSACAPFLLVRHGTG